MPTAISENSGFLMFDGGEGGGGGWGRGVVRNAALAKLYYQQY